ncbi:hypothetical protein CAPTEDRAFT_192143 [Capitella teleta]|uniref:Ion transport domain-containing protein n=1 Tax=Capitella teleta TaxID=283909 RepID=R7V853_CAPTE|nr:hypothetical protein CAPTEDRAFT_192143 [Capitella teleta]|eukprot:ELU15048.1 hypothetical protein CAPTEDRAFT_192143 [Capitella teleta]
MEGMALPIEDDVRCTIPEIRRKQSSVEIEGNKMSMSMCNQETDGEIFKLKDAFKSADFNLNDFLKSLTNAPGCSVEKDNDGMTTITRIKRIGTLGEDAKNEGHLFASESNLTQTTLTVKPIVTQKKRITVTKNDLPVEAGDNMLKELHLEHLIEDEKQIVVEEPKVQEEESKIKVPKKVEIVKLAEVPRDVFNSDYGEVSFVSSSEDDMLHTTMTSCFQGVSEKFRKKKKNNKRKIAKGIKKRKSFNDLKGGKVSMVEPEVSSPGQELPAVQMLVLTYNNMLTENPDKFKEMIFRAVKLNGLEVVKILCQLAMISSPLLMHFLNMEYIYKFPQTRAGSISWLTYDITEVASYSKYVYNKFSVLHVIAHDSGKLSECATSENNVLDSEPIKSIVEMKWKVYRWIYIAWCLIHAVQMSLFTSATFKTCIHTPLLFENQTQNSTVHFGDSESKLHHYMASFLIVPTLYILFELMDIFGTYPYSICFMRNQSFMSKILNRVKSEWTITGNSPYRCVCFAYSVSSIVWYIMFLREISSQVIALALSLLFGWIFVLFFTRGCRVTSRFSTMIQKIFFQDLMYFLAIYVIILAAFSFSINAFYMHSDGNGPGLGKIMFSLTNTITKSDSSQKNINKADFKDLIKAVLLFYALVSVILLMNMLIAMMNTSFETVRLTGSNIWKQQQLSIMLMLERRLCWIKILCCFSEKGVWHMDSDNRALLDVTVTHREKNGQQKKVSSSQLETLFKH